MVGTINSGIAATADNSIYGNKQVLYYYYTRDGGNSFTKFDPSNISSLAVGVYTVYALGWDGHILVRSDNPVTLNVGVTITLNATGGTDGKCYIRIRYFRDRSKQSRIIAYQNRLYF